MLHFKLWKRLLLMGDISVRTVLQHEWSSLSLRFTRIVTEKVFIHGIAASFIICHIQAGLGTCKIVHLAGTVAFAFGKCATACCQLINTWRSRGLVIRTRTSLLLSNFHPFPSGEGTFWSDTRALLQTKAWKFALSIWWWQRHSDVGGRSLLFRLFWQKKEIPGLICIHTAFPRCTNRADERFSDFLYILL